MSTKFKKIKEDYKKFKESSFYGEYKIVPSVLLLLDIIFVLAIIIGLNFRNVIHERGIEPGFIILVAVLGIAASLIAYILFFWFVVVPSSKIDYIKKKYSLETEGTEQGYYEAIVETLDVIDKITAQEYSGKLLQKQAELEAMKNQINPHFLYNTLDTIRGYASIEGAPITGSMIEILSHLFRYTVSSKQERVTISQEVGIAREYIKIQEYRINVKIQMIELIESDVQTDEYYVPKMILQPIIENCIKHGMPEDALEFVVKLHIYKTQSRLIINISDNGVGMDTETVAKLNQSFMANPLEDIEAKTPYLSKGGTGVGLQNINRRIKLMFGLEYGLYCYSAFGEGASFDISLPAGK